MQRWWQPLSAIGERLYALRLRRRAPRHVHCPHAMDNGAAAVRQEHGRFAAAPVYDRGELLRCCECGRYYFRGRWYDRILYR